MTLDEFDAELKTIRVNKLCRKNGRWTKISRTTDDQFLFALGRENESAEHIGKDMLALAKRQCVQWLNQT